MEVLKFKLFIKQFSKAYFKLTVQLFFIAHFVHLFKFRLGTKAVPIARGESKALLQISA